MHAHGVAMIFQDPTASLNPVFTIGDQLMTAIRYSSLEDRLTRKEIRERALLALREVALPDPARILDNYPVQLSGGMRQRICIAMALAANSQLMIADEPTTSLDVTIQDQVLRLLGKLVLEKDTSTILITHSLGIVREWTGRVYVMYAGNMVETAPTEELFRQPLHPYTQGLMKAVPKLTGEGIAEGIGGRIPNYLNPPQGCRFHPRCPHSMEICSQAIPPYFDVGARHQVACYLYRDGRV
jgi:peptide/nickel transport system ATP-binding protein